MAASSNSSVPITELFWSLLDKADRKFSKVRDVPSSARHRSDADFQKAFRIYTQLWKVQQENRQKLVDDGLRRWEVGEIASRIAQLYYGQYQRTSDSGYLSEAFVFYEAILSREYFKGDGPTTGGGGQEQGLVSKQLRFLARFLIVSLVTGRRDMATRLANLLKGLVDENKKTFQVAEYKEWKHVVQEIVRFLRADSHFMNMRPLRYSFVYDSHPDSLNTVVSCNDKRKLVLHDALLSSYCHNEVKFTELTLDTFRMLQSLEWEPRGFLSLKGGGDNSSSGTGPSRVNPLQDIRDPTLPPNPRKVVLYRPSVTHLLMVISTMCEELPPDGILLIHLSASGESGVKLPTTLTSGSAEEFNEKTLGRSDQETDSSVNSPTNSQDEPSSHNTENHRSTHEGCLWLGYRGSNGHGAEKGETTIMLLSPRARAPPVASSNDSSRYHYGSQFTMFLTAPVQALCSLTGISGVNVDKDTYDKAEKLFSLSLSEWETALLKSDSLHPIWVEILGDPFLRRLLLRFIFCRAVLALYSPTFQQEKFIPSCLPQLPDSVGPENRSSQSAVLRLAEFFGTTKHFFLSEGIDAKAGQHWNCYC